MKKMKSFILLLFILTINFVTCNQNQEKRKIKLSEESSITHQNERFTSTIHLEPTLRRAIAIMFFENITGDQNLEWLQKGLTEMLIRSLSQSSSLSVLSTDRIFEILNRLGESPEALDFDMAAIVAKEANVEAVLTGNISKNGDSLRISVKVLEPNQGKILKEASVEGAGLENIFSMVDQLTQKIMNSLQFTLGEQSKGIEDLMTNSLEAMRHYASGIDLINKYLLSDAIKQFEKAIEFDSTFVASYLQLCPLLYNQGEMQKGDQAFQKLLSLKYKATPQEKYQIDRLEAGIRSDSRKIIEVSQQWLKQYPDDLDANLNLAGIYYTIRNFEQAAHYYQKVLTIDPKYKTAYNVLGYVYANTGDYFKAIATLNKYKELAPDEPNPYDSIGEIYLFQGNFKNAEKHFKQALKVNESFVFSWLNIGETYLDNGEYKKALKILNKALEKATDPTDKANLYTQIGFTEWRLGQTDKAINSLKKSLECRGDQYLVMTWLDEVYKDHNDDIGRIQSLKQHYNFVKQTIETYPILFRTLANLSLWYDINVEETISIINEVLNTTDNQMTRMRGRYFLALLYLKTNQLDEYKKFAEDFATNFIEIIKSVPDIPRSYSTWRNFSIFNQYAYQFIDEGIEKYNQLIKLCLENDLKISEMTFRSLLADLYFHAGDREKAIKQLKIAGIPEESKWFVIGPFDNKSGFNKVFPPEKKIKLDKFYKGKSQSITWQCANDGFYDGYVDLQRILKQYNWSVGYGLIYIKNPDSKNVQIRVGTNDAAKVWLNDELVWKFNSGRDASFDDDIIKVALKPGLNKILIKVCNRISLWGYYFRITDEEGNGLPDIEFVSGDRF
jgi:tetratricopeptide (TPR) repeat protein